MVLNLSKLKGLPFKPGRFCLKKTGLPSLRRMKIAVARKMGEHAIMSISAASLSITCLMKS